MGEHAFIPTRRSDPARESAQRRAGPRRLLARSCAVRRPRLGTATMGQRRPSIMRSRCRSGTGLIRWCRVPLAAVVVLGPSSRLLVMCFGRGAALVTFSMRISPWQDLLQTNWHIFPHVAAANGPLTVHKHWESWPRCDATWWSGRLCAAGGPAVDRR